MREGTRLKDLGRWRSGGTPPKTDNDAWNGTLPWISAKDIASTTLRTPTTFITEQSARKHSSVVDSGSLLVIVRGMALAHGLPVVLTDRRCAFNQDLRALVTDHRNDPRFLYYALIGNRRSFGAHIDRAAHGTARVVDSIYDEWIWTPERATQAAIADVLDRECARIAATAGAVAAVPTAVSSSMQSAIASRLDAHGATYGRVKLGWFVRVLPGFPFASGGFLSGGAGDGVRLLRGMNVAVGHLRWDDAARWDRDDLSGLDPWRLREGDLVLGMDRPWISAGLRIATVTNADVPSYLLQRVAALRPLDDRIHPSYLRLWLERDLFRDETLHSMTGVAVPHISGGQIEAYRIAVPPRDEQDACVAEFERSSTQRGAVESAVRDLGARLAEYRDALITEAVTGQLDVTAVSDAQMDERLHRRADAASA